MVLASVAHAQRMGRHPDIDIPVDLCERVRADRLAGVLQAACAQVIQLRDSGAFDGVHLVPVGRYREVAGRLEQLLR